MHTRECREKNPERKSQVSREILIAEIEIYCVYDGTNAATINPNLTRVVHAP